MHYEVWIPKEGRPGETSVGSMGDGVKKLEYAFDLSLPQPRPFAASAALTAKNSKTTKWQVLHVS